MTRSTTRVTVGECTYNQLQVLGSTKCPVLLGQGKVWGNTSFKMPQEYRAKVSQNSTKSNVKVNLCLNMLSKRVSSFAEDIKMCTWAEETKMQRAVLLWFISGSHDLSATTCSLPDWLRFLECVATCSRKELLPFHFNLFIYTKTLQNCPFKIPTFTPAYLEVHAVCPGHPLFLC